MNIIEKLDKFLTDCKLDNNPLMKKRMKMKKAGFETVKEGLADNPLMKKKMGLKKAKFTVVKEGIEQDDLAEDIMSLLNSLDDEMLDDDQIELKNRILDANYTIAEEEPDENDVDSDIDDIDDIIVPETDIDTGEEEATGLDDVIDTDVQEDVIDIDDMPQLGGVEDFEDDNSPNFAQFESKKSKGKKLSKKS